MLARRINPRLIKLHRPYSVEEAARALGVHKNSVRGWIKDSLPTVDHSRPLLILGQELRAYLEGKRKSAKQPCPPGTLYCFKCRQPRPPAMGMVEATRQNATTGNRLFVNGCLWVLPSGAHWCDLPERYGRWKTVHRRFSRWCHAGVWERVFAALMTDRDNQYLMIDSTIVRAHQQAATGKGGAGSGVGALPRWIDDQDLHAGRCTRAAASLYRDRRPGR